MENRNSVLSFKFVHPDEVKKVILGLKNSKSCGFDNIDTYALKLAVDEILPAVTHIINISLQQWTFPSPSQSDPPLQEGRLLGTQKLPAGGNSGNSE